MQPDRKLVPGDEFEPGASFGDYVLLDRVAVGGEATIWSAWDPENKRVVAIKLTPLPFGEHNGGIARIEDEVKIVTSLDHPNIVPLYGSGVIYHHSYLCMRYFPFGSLDDLISSGPLPIPEVLRLAAQIVVTLQYIHSRNVVHRDLKPTNILLDAQRRIYLTDFGLARPLSNTTRAFHTGHGTAPYAPPEQHTQAPITHVSDIYSLGIMLFEMFTGRLPWNGDFALAIRQLDRADQLPDPRDVNAALPAALAGALRRLTARDPLDRPTTAVHAFGLVVDAVAADQTAALLHDSGVSAVKRYLAAVPRPGSPQEVIAEDARALLRHTLNTWNPEQDKLALGRTHFAFLDAVYSQPDQYDVTVDEQTCLLMLRGALVHGFNQDYWWAQVSDPARRLQVCEQIIATESEQVIERTLVQMLQDPQQAPSLSGMSRPAKSRLNELAASLSDPALSGSALDMLARVLEAPMEWRGVRFTATEDLRIADLALSDSVHSQRAARLIGQMRSERAVRVLVNAMQHGNVSRALSALTEVLDTAGDLPQGVPFSVQFRTWFELVRRQLFLGDSAPLLGYLMAALGCALALGIHVYVSYRLPSLMDTARILNALGSGVLFGPVIGGGVFMARLIAIRLTVVPRLLRALLALAVGMLLINFGLVGYHVLFLNAAPRGWLIALGALIMAFGFALGASALRSRWVAALLSTLTTALGLGLTWQLASNTFLTPMLYYEYGQPLQTAVMIVVSSVVIGLFAHAVNLQRVEKAAE
ncbi:MAG: hypothetical protein Kow00124_31000 [Anaerolineae bacterium]